MPSCEPSFAEPSGLPEEELGLYLHVPFCLRKCAYCSFCSTAGLPDAGRRYLAAVVRQMDMLADSLLVPARPLTSIFFGGGTPTMLPAAALGQLLAACLDHFPGVEEIEISVEANPATVDAAGLEALRRAGFNRLSIGVQSFDDHALRRLGRPHSAGDAAETLHLARQAGFANISLDLMYGLPGQRRQSWQDTLEQALGLGPQHLSVYELTIEEGTPFAREQKQGRLDLPDEDDVLLMLEATQSMLGQAGFGRYEISNYAQFGFQCRHNLNYWRTGSWIGLGPSAVSSLGGVRRTAERDAAKFCELVEDGQEVWQESESLEPEAAFREAVVMGLRMMEGVSLDALRQRFGIDAREHYGEALIRLVRLGLLKVKQDRMLLTERGMLLANMAMAELV